MLMSVASTGAFAANSGNGNGNGNNGIASQGNEVQNHEKKTE